MVGLATLTRPIWVRILVPQHNMENLENNFEQKEGWQDETAERAESVSLFIKNNAFGSIEKPTKYDGLTELHLSGMNGEVLQKVREGSKTAEKINVLYKDGEIVQIHAIFNSEGKGQYLDFYIKEKALKDYLSQE